MAIVAAAVTMLSEAETGEAEELVPLNPVVYGLIAFVLLLVLLLVTTRLNADR